MAIKKLKNRLNAISWKQGSGTLFLCLTLIIVGLMFLTLITINSVAYQRSTYVQTRADVIADGTAEYARTDMGTIDAAKAQEMYAILITSNDLDDIGVTGDMDTSQFADNNVAITLSGIMENPFGADVPYSKLAITHVKEYSINLNGVNLTYPLAYQQAGIGWITYDNSDGTHHEGIDIQVSYQPVYAFGDGVVTQVVRGWSSSMGTSGMSSYGNFIEISHGNGVYTRYGHLSVIPSTIQVGTTVTMGQRIATSGNTGNSTGPHLHVAVYVDGDPMISESLNYAEANFADFKL